MFKKKLVALSAIMIAGLMTFQANVSVTDTVRKINKPNQQWAQILVPVRSKVLELLGVKENELEDSVVIK